MERKKMRGDKFKTWKIFCCTICFVCSAHQLRAPNTITSKAFVVYLPHYDGVFEPIHFPCCLLVFFTNQAQNAKENIFKNKPCRTSIMWLSISVRIIGKNVVNQKKTIQNTPETWIYLQTRFVEIAENSGNGLYVYTAPCFSLTVFAITIANFTNTFRNSLKVHCS